MKSQGVLQGFSHCVICAGLLFSLSSAPAQVSSIDSVILNPRTFNDVPGSTLVSFANYPSIVYFSDANVSAASGFANRHTWAFSSDGTNAYRFSNNEVFHAELTLTLTADPTSPRKEAGFLLDTVGGQGQFIVNTDAHEVVAFGGPLPFYAFPATFFSGDTITLGMTYLKNEFGRNAVVYTANGISSPPQEFTNLEQGIIDNSTLGGYLQIVNASSSPNNGASAAFQNIMVTPEIPEPSVLSLAGLGIIGLLLRRLNRRLAS